MLHSNVQGVALQWHEAIIEGEKNTSDTADLLKSGHDESESELSSDDEAHTEEAPPVVTTARPVPENVEFKRTLSCNLNDLIHKSMGLIRRALLNKCEATMVNLIEFYMSRDLEILSEESTDVATRNFCLIYGLLLQFTHFSSYFVDDKGEGMNVCGTLENEFSRLMGQHLRSVHIEAMRTTGMLLRHESWQLAPLELAGESFKKEAKEKINRCGNSGKETIGAIYEAVGDLLLGSTCHEYKAEHQLFIITARAKDRGYQYCRSFGDYLDKSPPSHSTDVPCKNTLQKLQRCFGMSSKEFILALVQFVETKPGGKRTVSILTQSAVGLVKWTTRLLAIGKLLPLVVDDSHDAVMSLFDLYILTIFRFCAGNKSNEDVLVGFGRGTATCLTSSSPVSITMEADTVAPLPRAGKDFVKTQEFIRSSRKRLANIVNLDKFQSSDDDMCVKSPRSKNELVNHAKRLEKKTAAAYSCFFATILIDVASEVFNFFQSQDSLWTNLKNMATSMERNVMKNKTSLEMYALAAVSMVPKLVTQATLFATVNSVSGNEVIFQIMCKWENNSLQRGFFGKAQSNSYVDSLCERASLLWGYLCSSTKLPPPALHHVWDQLVRSAFLLLLEGFSKVSHCSTEDRSLMSLDLATLHHGLIPDTVQAEAENNYPKITPPPQACREEMMQYVGTFIKVFYFSSQDILKWITDNCGDYHLDHTLSLASSTAMRSKDERLVLQEKELVVRIYSNRKYM